MDEAKEVKIETVSTNAKKKGMSRRKFLQLIAGAGVGLAAETALGPLAMLPDVNNNNIAGEFFSKAVAQVAARPLKAEAMQTEKLISDIAESGENTRCITFLQVITDAVSDFRERNPKTEVKWEKGKPYLGTLDVIPYLSKPVTKEESFGQKDNFLGKSLFQCMIENQSMEAMMEVYTMFVQRLPHTFWEVINTANSTQIAFPGTDLYKNHYPEQGNVFSNKVVENYYSEIKDELGAIYKEEGELLPMSRVLEHLLGRNSGNLLASLGDMAGFMKFMVRSYWGNDDAPRAGVQIEWLRTHIQDQVNKKFSLNSIEMDKLGDEDQKKTISSVWGLMYHIPHLVYMLGYLSPDIVRGAGVFEYVSHQHVAHAYKLKVDVEEMDGLNDIFGYLQSLK